MSSGKNFDAKRFVEHYRTMWRIRAFEEAAIKGSKEGLVKGAIHPSIGQEAVATGVCNHLNVEDILLSTHRGHGHTLVKGAAPSAMMRELFGREGGTCGGKGGSMHIADFGVGMLGANGVVGANILIAAGAAHGIKLQGDGRVVVCLFGDGAINRGPFLEGLNWAAVYNLPVLFVCEDNGFAATTRTAALTAGPGPGARAESLGIPASLVDGNDIVAVDEMAGELVAKARAEGPQFLHAKTYRLTGHTSVDPAAYRPDDEVARQWEVDPITRAGEVLQAAGVHADELRAIRDAATAEMAQVYAEAQTAPWPEPANAFTDVQDTQLVAVSTGLA
ncbi:MAG: thiamine pyrophosphate-dependent dehydrogenase E1 component subunit alpha [Gammaproteobacteria bacterium]|nr:thiamine pyrophosphate-dependent dehydrogenase E1 component subunit alpha [Gammaproteobacteria bacterium]